ncbi:MAG: hypothetical protein ABJF65_00205 [Reichenbachiella sp.]|uniref:hypothetical protein n=1 Tax=Reichenbachiella sp. TaxID=2184521 RepID=UPI003267F4AC
MKYYFFRDIDNEPNLLDDRTYHAAGYVESVISEIEKPSDSGKDLAVVFFQPFEGTFNYTYRSFDFVELFEVEKHKYDSVVEDYEYLRNQLDNSYGEGI